MATHKPEMLKHKVVKEFLHQEVQQNENINILLKCFFTLCQQQIKESTGTISKYLSSRDHAQILNLANDAKRILRFSKLIQSDIHELLSESDQQSSLAIAKILLRYGAMTRFHLHYVSSFSHVAACLGLHSEQDGVASQVLLFVKECDQHIRAAVANENPDQFISDRPCSVKDLLEVPIRRLFQFQDNLEYLLKATNSNTEEHEILRRSALEIQCHIEGVHRILMIAKERSLATRFVTEWIRADAYLSSSAKILKIGKLGKFSNKQASKVKEYQFVLCEGTLMYGASIRSGTYRHIRSFSTNGMVVHNGSGEHTFEIQTESQTLVLKSRTAADRDDWVHSILRSINQQTSTTQRLQDKSLGKAPGSTTCASCYCCTLASRPLYSCERCLRQNCRHCCRIVPSTTTTSNGPIYRCLECYDATLKALVHKAMPGIRFKPKSTPTTEYAWSNIASVLNSRESVASQELQLITGDRIWIDKLDHDGWAYGTNFRTGECGIFPLNLVTLLPDERDVANVHIFEQVAKEERTSPSPLHETEQKLKRPSHGAQSSSRNQTQTTTTTTHGVSRLSLRRSTVGNTRSPAPNTNPEVCKRVTARRALLCNPRVFRELEAVTTLSHEEGSGTTFAIDKRTKVMQELLSSEQRYLQDLTKLENDFVQPLFNDFNSGLPGVSNQLLSTVDGYDHVSSYSFLVSVSTIAATSELFLADLSSHLLNWDPHRTCVGNLFLSYAKMFQHYDDYNAMFEQASKNIREAFSSSQGLLHLVTRNNSDDNQVERTQVLSELSSLLILPIQRIPRYLLLMKQLLSETTTHHPDRATLIHVIDRYESLTNYLNDSIKAREAVLRMAQIEQEWGPVARVPTYFANNFKNQMDCTTTKHSSQGSMSIQYSDYGNTCPKRVYLLDGELLKQGRKNRVPYEFVLFNDVLMYGKPEGVGHSGSRKIKHHRSIPLVQCEVRYPSPELETNVSTQTSQSSPNLVQPNRKSLSTLRASLSARSVSVVDDNLNFAFEIVSREKSFRVYAPTLHAKLRWYEAIDSAARKMRDSHAAKNILPSDRVCAPDTNDNITIPSSSLACDGNNATRQNDFHESPTPSRAGYDDVMTYPTVAPVWQDDNQATVCQLCRASFSIVRRRHHCRACGLLVCDSCSTHREVLRHIHQTKSLRVCNICVCTAKNLLHLETKLGQEEETTKVLLRKSDEHAANVPIPKQTHRDPCGEVDKLGSKCKPHRTSTMRLGEDCYSATQSIAQTTSAKPRKRSEINKNITDGIRVYARFDSDEESKVSPDTAQNRKLIRNESWRSSFELRHDYNTVRVQIQLRRSVGCTTLLTPAQKTLPKPVPPPLSPRPLSAKLFLALEKRNALPDVTVGDTSKRLSKKPPVPPRPNQVRFLGNQRMVSRNLS